VGKTELTVKKEWIDFGFKVGSANMDKIRLGRTDYVDLLPSVPRQVGMGIQKERRIQ
jgi:hypothetical protein